MNLSSLREANDGLPIVTLRRQSRPGVRRSEAEGIDPQALFPFDHPLYVLYSSEPRVFRSASFIAVVGCCSSTSLNSNFIATFGQAIASSTSQPAAG